LIHDPSRGRSLFHAADRATTWEWDGTDWSLRPSLVAPSPRQEHALAYDARRGRTVLFGGRDFGTNEALGDTWEWDGATWTRRFPVMAPPPRWEATLVYDPDRRRVLLFGGLGDWGGPYHGDTWEWDGTGWTQLFPASSPDPRHGHSLAGDPARGKVVLFGGVTASGPTAETWEWDGTDWLRRSPSTHPTASRYHDLAFDAGRARCVLVVPVLGLPFEVWEWNGTDWTMRPGGIPAAWNKNVSLAHDAGRGRIVLVLASYPWIETWEWDGSDWTRLSPRPAPRGLGVGLAHDSGRGRTVLFGGSEDPPAETWEWDGTDWAPRSPDVSPPPRYSPALAYDSDRGRTVLFGSRNTRTPYRDTWEWDGTTWTPHFPRNQPPPAGYLAYDSVRRRTVLQTGSLTWEWDGTDWTWRRPPTGPSTGGPLAFDSRRGVTVLFNGTETWEWDGTVWTRRSPQVSPGFREESALAYDVARARTVLFGGGVFTDCICSAFNDLWDWDGTEWTPRLVPPSVSPSPRVRPVLAYDASRGRMILFGGHSHFCFAPKPPIRFCGYQAWSHDTWELAVPCDVVGRGHPVGSVPLSCLHAPEVGARFCLSFPSPAFEGHVALGPAPPPRVPAPVGPPLFCEDGSVHVAPMSVFAVPGNPALWCLRLPDEPALVGQSFNAQGVAREPGGCYRLTDAVVVTIQPVSLPR
jgi:hypothetical protein